MIKRALVCTGDALSLIDELGLELDHLSESSSEIKTCPRLMVRVV